MRSRWILVFLIPFTALAWSQQVDEAARDMVDGAKHFLGALAPEQQTEAKIGFGTEERTNWHYIPRDRKGLPYKSMTPGQRKLAHAFLATGLSHRGMKKTLDVMYLDQILFEIQKRDIRDPDKYYFSIFGEPSETGAWGWRVEGHHLSLNFTLRGGRVVSSSPAFWGANPAVVQDGPNKGMRALADEEILGRALLHSIDDRKRVVIAAEAPSDIVTGASRRAEIGKPAGLALSDMSAPQKEAVLHLVRLYANRMRPEIAEHEWTRIEKAGLEKIHFAWAGGAESGEPHYYRIHGPTFLVEYDNTQNNANHIHTVWRDLSGDFGDADPLADHYARSPHHKQHYKHPHRHAEE